MDDYDVALHVAHHAIGQLYGSVDDDFEHYELVHALKCAIEILVKRHGEEYNGCED